MQLNEFYVYYQLFAMFRIGQWTADTAGTKIRNLGIIH